MVVRKWSRIQCGGGGVHGDGIAELNIGVSHKDNSL